MATKYPFLSTKNLPNVNVIGFHKNIADLYSKSNIACLPSYREGLPRSLVEAAACGRAVVTTDVPGCRDAIEPNKRMLSSMTPTIVEGLDGNLFLVLGSPGGSTIITSVAQILINVIDFNMSLKEAVEKKRFHHQWLPDVIYSERYTFSEDVIKRLKKYGHEVIVRSSIGQANCIQFTEDGLKYAVSDTRRGGTALAY